MESNMTNLEIYWAEKGTEPQIAYLGRDHLAKDLPVASNLQPTKDQRARH